MVKTFLAVILLVLLTSIFPQKALAQVAGSSATMEAKTASASALIVPVKSNLAIKRLVIRKMLEKYNSPMVDSVDTFMDACNKYDLDCYLLPAITGLESTFGNAILPGSYNPFGWGGGLIVFKNWNDGIMTVAQGLRQNYINRGADSIEGIGRIYSASPTWAIRIRNFMAQMEAEEQKNQLFFDSSRVQL